MAVQVQVSVPSDAAAHLFLLACAKRQNNVLEALGPGCPPMWGNHVFCMADDLHGCMWCGPTPTRCVHTRRTFQTTQNFKRDIHYYLFWVSWLGWDFPITDEMLASIEGQLEPLCEYGFGRQAPSPYFHPRCINPQHYHVEDRKLALLLYNGIAPILMHPAMSVVRELFNRFYFARTVFEPERPFADFARQLRERVRLSSLPELLSPQQ